MARQTSRAKFASVRTKVNSTVYPVYADKRITSWWTVFPKGNVINVPVDIQSTINCLPRPMDENFTVAIQLKKKLSYKKLISKKMSDR